MQLRVRVGSVLSSEELGPGSLGTRSRYHHTSPRGFRRGLDRSSDELLLWEAPVMLSEETAGPLLPVTLWQLPEASEVGIGAESCLGAGHRVGSCRVVTEDMT